jgi:hypothetical protein
MCLGYGEESQRFMPPVLFPLSTPSPPGEAGTFDRAVKEMLCRHRLVGLIASVDWQEIFIE